MSDLHAAVESPTTILTSFRRDGSGVPTPVWAVVVDDVAYFTAPASTHKVRRIAANADVTVAPGDKRGEPVGDPVDAVATLVEDPATCDAVHAALVARHPIGHRAITLAFRVRGVRSATYRLERRTP